MSVMSFSVHVYEFDPTDQKCATLAIRHYEVPAECHIGPKRNKYTIARCINVSNSSSPTPTHASITECSSCTQTCGLPQLWSLTCLTGAETPSGRLGYAWRFTCEQSPSLFNDSASVPILRYTEYNDAECQIALTNYTQTKQGCIGKENWICTPNGLSWNSYSQNNCAGTVTAQQNIPIGTCGKMGDRYIKVMECRPSGGSFRNELGTIVLANELVLVLFFLAFCIIL
jgi:hypothetical protein